MSKTETPNLDRFLKPSKASKPMAIFNLFVRMPALIIIQVLAALALDGWLSVALWVNASYNILLAFITIFGLTMVAVEVSQQHKGTTR